MDVISTFAKASLRNLGDDTLIMISGAEDEERDDLSSEVVPEGNAGADQIGDVDGCLECHD